MQSPADVLLGMTLRNHSELEAGERKCKFPQQLVLCTACASKDRTCHLILAGLGEAGSQAKQPPQQMVLRHLCARATGGLHAGARQCRHRTKESSTWVMLACKHRAFGAWRA